MKLYVKQIGNPDFPRYAIKCENGTWWNDHTKVWTHHAGEATLYASLSVVREEWKRLQFKLKTKVIELEATVKVHLNRDKPLTHEEIEALAQFMADASVFRLNYRKKRPKGFEDVNISTQIYWDLKVKGK